MPRHLLTPLTTDEPVTTRLGRAPDGTLFSRKYGTALFPPNPSAEHVLAMADYLDERALLLERSIPSLRRRGILFLSLGTVATVVSSAMITKIQLEYKNCGYCESGRRSQFAFVAFNVLLVGGVGLGVSSLAFFTKIKPRTRQVQAFRDESNNLRAIKWELEPYGAGARMRLRF